MQGALKLGMVPGRLNLIQGCHQSFPQPRGSCLHAGMRHAVLTPHAQPVLACRKTAMLLKSNPPVLQWPQLPRIPP